jgi:hypothetical protein
MGIGAANGEVIASQARARARCAGAGRGRDAPGAGRGPRYPRGGHSTGTIAMAMM